MQRYRRQGGCICHSTPPLRQDGSILDAVQMPFLFRLPELKDLREIRDADLNIEPLPVEADDRVMALI